MLDQRTVQLTSQAGEPWVDSRRHLAWQGTETSLSPSEVRILRALLSASSRVVGRMELADVADTDARRGLDAHMYRLRHKLQEFPGLILETVPKRGFRLLVCPA
jgi:DNA-binding winged helix-turn-helix (wHTH) protein